MKRDITPTLLRTRVARAAAGTSALYGDPSIPGSGGQWAPNRWMARTNGMRDARSDVLRTLRLDRADSRMLARTSPIAAGAVQTNVDRIVGTGLALVSMPDRRVLGWTEDQAMEWKREVQTEFSIWADSTDCDWAGTQTFYEKQGLTLRSSLESGDCFTNLPDAPSRAGLQPYKLRLQTIEGDRVANPAGQADTADVAGGVRFTGGAPTSYFVLDHHPGAAVISGDRYAGQWIDRVGASGRRRILHHFRQLRPEQPRGIPYLTVIAGLLDQLNRYTEAEITAAVASAKITGIVTSPAGQTQAPVWGATDAELAQAGGEVALEAGAVIGLAPGENFDLADPNRPNSAFDPFVLAIITQIGMALGLPRELLVKAFNASYSASKAALLDAWIRFRAERAWLASSFCQPVFETWLAEAVAIGRISAPGFFREPALRWAYTRAGWHGDSMGSINPKDEVAAYLAAIDGRLMTRERGEWELFGTDWYDTLDSKEREQQLLKEADMLPVPKAGAAAPPPASDSTGAEARQAAETQAFASLAASVAVMASRESPAQTFNIAGPSVTVEPAKVDIHQGDMTVHLPESNIQLDAHIEQPDITIEPAQVHVSVPPAQVVVQPQKPTRQHIERDADGEIVSITTEPIFPTLN